MRKILLICLGIIIVVCLELICRRLLPERDLNIKESINTICREDTALLWRQKENIDLMFQGKNVRTNSLGLRNREVTEAKNPDTLRIICLGASLTFGWGVDQDKTYPAILEDLLKKNFPARNAEVINAGEVGFSSYQGRIFFDGYLKKYHPDVVTVSYLLNDVDKVRFFRAEGFCDSRLPPEADWKVALKNFIADKRIYFLGKREMMRMIEKDKKKLAEIYRHQYENSSLRVLPGEYRKNLEKLAAECKANGSSLIFIVMPANLSLPKISAGQDGTLLSNEYYLRGKECADSGDYSKAADFFKQALNFQVFSCKQNSRRYQKIMKQVAGNYGMPVVDADKLFFESSVMDKKVLFNGPADVIHPSSAGHRIIAEALYRCLKGSGKLK